jgi:hypothetical protein
MAFMRFPSIELLGQRYEPVESFWQSLKFTSDEDRRRLAQLNGPDARAEGDRQGYGTTIYYRGGRLQSASQSIGS